MKKIFIYILTSLLFVGCTKDFDSINTDPSRLTEVGPREMPFMFARAQSSSALTRSFYQTVQNLGSDLYAQYFALTVTSFQADRYMTTPDWQRRFWTVVYVDTAPQLRAILDNANPNSGEQALANILWVYSFHRLTDHFGPIPYFGAATPATTIPYDAQDVIYDDFFKRLTTAVTDLKALAPGTTVFKGYELMYDGNVDYWIRFANTLRLRLALRISDVDPVRARQEAEAAVVSGIFTDNIQNASLAKSLSGDDTNGLSQVGAWNEFGMSSTIASYLKGYSDPRLPIYFQPSINGEQFNSLRNGLPPVSLGLARNKSDQNSNVGTYWVLPVRTSPTQGTFSPNLTARFQIMNAAEAFFLQAEGALNGWNMGGGTAQSYYEQGIRASLSQWGITDPAITTYISSTAVPVPPGDTEISPAVSNVPVQWGASEAIQRKQIGTQKWLAIFPNGMEAWAEFRRTGFPDMYPVVQSDNPLLPSETFIKRLPFPITEENTNAVELNKGRALLGGPDNVATRLWWDTTP